MKLFIVIGTVSVIVGLASLGLKRLHPEPRDTASNNVAVVRVAYGSVESDVIADGTMVPNMVVDVTVLPGMSGMTSQVYANIGDYVEKGQILAEVNPIQQREDAQTAGYNLLATKAHYTVVVHPHRVEEIQSLQLKLQQDRLAVTDAATKLKLLNNPHLPLEIASFRDHVAVAETALGYADTNSEREHHLFDQDLITKEELDTADKQLLDARAAADEAHNGLALISMPARPEEIAMARNNLAAAKLALQQDELAYRVDLEGGRSEDVAQAAAAVGQSTVALERSRRVLKYRSIRAPISGHIVQRNINPGEIAVSAPSRTNSSLPLSANPNAVFVISDDSAVQFLANMDERFFHSVAPGQKASVGVEALPGRTFSGTVVNVNTLINPDKLSHNLGQGINANSPLTFPVWIRVPNVDHLLVPGQVGITRLTQHRRGLLIPQEAANVFSVGTGTVRVVKNGVISTRRIRFDGGTGGNYRILSGLKAGDQVTISNTDKISDGTHVSVRAATGGDLSPMAF